MGMSERNKRVVTIVLFQSTLPEKCVLDGFCTDVMAG